MKTVQILQTLESRNFAGATCNPQQLSRQDVKNWETDVSATTGWLGTVTGQLYIRIERLTF